MDDLFLTQRFDWKVVRSSHLDRALNLPLRLLGRSPVARTAALVDRSIEWAVGRRFNAVRSGVSTSVEQRINMFHLLAQTVAFDVPGEVVELGCNEGQSAVLMQTVLAGHGSAKELHLYDSFAGLPATADVDGDSYRAGELSTSADVVRANFARYGLAQPVVHPGWFEETLPGGLPERICFAHLDGDLHDSILVSLRHVYPRLSPGAICLIDDYCDPESDPDGWNHLPGVKAACDEFLADKPERVSPLYAGPYSHGYFRKADRSAAA